MAKRPTGNEDLPPIIEQLRTTRPRRGVSFGARLRSYFLTGLVIAAPISITVYVTWWFIRFVDTTFKPLLPAQYDPDTYLPFNLPGVGLVLALVLLTLLGALTANLFGLTVVRYGERLLDQMPLVRNLYRALKQIFETVLSQSNQSFKQVGLIEYPRKGLWAIVFISTTTRGEIAEKAEEGEEKLSVFLPTTPNPTSGFLLFVPKRDIQILDMSVEDAAKLVISAGLVVPGVLPPKEASKEPEEAAEAPKTPPAKPRGKRQPASASRMASSRSNT